MRPAIVFRAANTSVTLTLAATMAAVASLTVTAARADGSWRKAPEPALPAMMFVAPLLVMAAGSLTSAVVALLREPVEFDLGNQEVARSLRRARELICGSAATTVFVLMFVIGVAAVIANTASLSHAVAVFGRDLFYSKMHPMSFILTRIYFSLLWCVVMPYVVIVTICSEVVLIPLVRVATANDAIVLRPLWHDDSAGMSRIGSVTYRLVSVMLLVTIMAAIPMFLNEGVLFSRFVVALAPIASLAAALSPTAHLQPYIKRWRSAELEKLDTSIEKAYCTGDWSLSAKLLSIRSAIAATATYPLPIGKRAFSIAAVLIQVSCAVLALFLSFGWLH